MGLVFRKRIRGPRSSSGLLQTFLNLSLGWPSVSVKVGPVTFNSRGRVTVGGPKGSGVSWRKEL
jgi:hypothetical protein